MKFKILISVILICTVLLSGCGCSHQWLDANCESPKICSLCGETEGAALSHNWTEASCKAPRSCLACGNTEGEALSHNWIDASCTKAKYCTLCGEEDGEVPGHSPAKAKYSNLDFNTASGDYSISCDICGEIIESGSGILKALHDGDEFLCSCIEWYERILNMHKEDDLGGFGDMDENDALFALIYWDTDFVTRITFKNSDGSSPSADCTFSSLYANLGWNRSPLEVALENNHYLHGVPVMVACDPTLTHNDALELYQELMRESTLSNNGLYYELFYDDETGSLTMSVTVE